jgi:hypothetical protein
MGENFWNYLWLGAAAFFGVLARAARWTKEDGSFSPQKAFLELLTAPAIGLLAGGLAKYFDPNLDPMILGAGAAFLGLVGPAAIEAAALKWFQKRIGVE